MKYAIKHLTQYTYLHPSVLGYNYVWVFPLSLPNQKVLHSKVFTVPRSYHYSERKDFFGNTYAFFTIEESHLELSITSESQVIRTENELALDQSTMTWDEFRAQLAIGNNRWNEVKIFLLPSPMISFHDALRTYALPSFPAGRPVFESIYDLMERIYDEFEYNPDFSTIATPSIEVLHAKKGVCQDYAHLAIGCLRSLGLPARYVSGYIETYAADTEEQLEGTAASHAWFSAFIPEMGWVDFDPTNNKLAGYQHISVAHGRDYSDIPPIKGVVYSGSNHQLSVAVDVKRIP